MSLRSFFNVAAGYPYTGDRGAYALLPSDQVDVRVLVPNAAKVHAIPTGAKVVVFSANADFWCRFGTSGVAAAIPSADVTDGSSPELNPAARLISDGATHIALIAPAAATVTLAFYAA